MLRRRHRRGSVRPWAAPVLGRAQQREVQVPHRLPDALPAVQALDRGTPLRSESAPQWLVSQHVAHRSGEGVGIVPHENVVPVSRSQPLTADRRAYDRLPHVPGIENLEPGAPPDPKRHDIARGIANVWTDVGNVARQLDRGTITVPATGVIGYATHPPDRRFPV